MDKSLALIADYKVRDEQGKVLVSEIYNVSRQKTAVSNRNYKEAEEQHAQNHVRTKLHEELMQKLAKTVVGQIIEERRIK
ncbi:MAG: Unknown protein [uncultured Sulfurovum sp.]|uniref:Uncharacterized protein n=1 Tax=uncultured Sulfurovum sp. TaxID=269237 RepID=A0A6S6TC00_9BACT|nr:MAG: Unknown protein [uncultured Sulfurovum sp.]